MDIESQRDLQLLELLDRDRQITQRTLAIRIGIALGLTNLCLKRLVRQGYVKTVAVAPNRLVYSLTPRGISRKAKLAYEFTTHTLHLYRDTRRQLRESLEPLVTRQRRIAIYGTGDVAELVYLLLKEIGLELVAVFGDTEGTFLGHTVRPVAIHQTVAYDLLIIAVLERPAGTVKHLVRAGIPPGKLVRLQPAQASGAGRIASR